MLQLSNVSFYSTMIGWEILKQPNHNLSYPGSDAPPSFINSNPSVPCYNHNTSVHISSMQASIPLPPLLGQVKKRLDVSRPRPLPFLLPPPFFSLFTNFNTNLYIALVVVQKMYIQLSNSFGHRSAERILSYENCSYSSVT